MKWLNFNIVLIFFLEKYDYVGRLLKPGESHSYYTDEEETPTNKLHLENPKQFENDKPNDNIKDGDKNESKTDDNSSSTEESDVTKFSNGSTAQDSQNIEK